MPFQPLFDFRSPTRLVHGPGAIHRLPKFFSKKQKILVVTDAGLVRAGVVEQVTRILEKAAVPHAVFDGVLANPPARCVHAGQRLYKREECTGIVGLGGGSAMDVAKMIGVLATNGGRIERYLGANKFAHDLPPLVCIPTTYGTGSEVTPFAVLTNPKTRNKDPLISWKIAPQVGILDAELVVALPAAVGGPTGMDALTHALESYISLTATPLTEALALSALELIGLHLRQACANDYELEATENMLLASSMAGMAFSQTRLGNVHAMSHPVGAQFEVHHGTANAILLPHVMEFNLPACFTKFANIATALGTGTNDLNPREAAVAAIDTIWEMNHDLGIPENLGAVGVRSRAIPSMARLAMESPNVDVNPRKTSREDIAQIFKRAL